MAAGPLHATLVANTSYSCQAQWASLTEVF